MISATSMAPTRRQPHRIAVDLLPGELGARVQSFLTKLYRWGLAKRQGQVAFRIRLPIAVIAAFAILCIPLAVLAEIARRRPPPAVPRFVLAIPSRALSSSAVLMTGLWLANGLIVTFLVYALNRYSYYVIPYLAASAAIFLDGFWTLLGSRFPRA